MIDYTYNSPDILHLVLISDLFFTKGINSPSNSGNLSTNTKIYSSRMMCKSSLTRWCSGRKQMWGDYGRLSIINRLISIHYIRITPLYYSLPPLLSWLLYVCEFARQNRLKQKLFKRLKRPLLVGTDNIPLPLD